MNNENLNVNNLNVNCITSNQNKFHLDTSGNLTVKSITTLDPLPNEQINIGSIINTIFPIGSIYLSVTNQNPSVFLGGTWQQIKDKFLLACGDIYQNGTTGGTSTHTLTIDEIPSHSHLISNFNSWGKPSSGGGFQFYPNQSGNMGKDASEETGGGVAHNNMPPYLAVYIWKKRHKKSG